VWDASRKQDIAHHQLARLEKRRKGEEDRAATTATAATAASVDIEQDASAATIIQQKRSEREVRRRRRLAAEAAAADGDSNAGADADVEPDAADVMETTGVGERERERGGASAAVPSSSSSLIYTISVPTTSDAFAWYDYNDNEDHDDDSGRQRQRHTYETLDMARAAGVWSYPTNADERARCEVFRDLWEKGYYMGGGVKFGGDWLVYPGACFLFSLTLSVFFSLFLAIVCCVDTRRSAALSFALCCNCADFPVRPVAPDRSRGAWPARYGYEEGTSFVWLGS
jgi:tRNA-splicing endonuclease subunit Sen34